MICLIFISPLPSYHCLVPVCILPRPKTHLTFGHIIYNIVIRCHVFVQVLPIVSHRHRLLDSKRQRQWLPKQPQSHRPHRVQKRQNSHQKNKKVRIRTSCLRTKKKQKEIYRSIISSTVVQSWINKWSAVLSVEKNLRHYCKTSTHRQQNITSPCSPGHSARLLLPLSPVSSCVKRADGSHNTLRPKL